MCGIFAAFNIQGTYETVRQLCYSLSRRQRHRGPDRSGLLMIEAGVNTWHVFSHERLNIVDLSEAGRQPFEMVDVVHMTNGEIYSSQELRPELEKTFEFKGHSDCEVVGMLYKQHGPEEFWKYLDGMWGTVLYDKSNQRFYVGRDHLGIIPVYWGVTSNGALLVASELKCIHDQVQQVQQLLPGHYFSNDMVLHKWYNPTWHNMDLIPSGEMNLMELRNQLIRVVKRELIGDAAFGVFISGGVDSSIIAGIVAQLIKKGEIDLIARGMHKVHSFCIGLEGSPDLHYAQQVASFHGFEHHSFTYTVDEGIDMIPEVIYHTETFNNTTIRASTPMYYMCRLIKAMGIKTCLTGEGSDELFGGYLYFHKAPNATEFHQETIRKLHDLHKYDLLRANKSCLSWGIEVRPPFMNRDFVEYVMQIDPKWKMCQTHNPPIEKYILRKAFEDLDNPFVPHDILWRQKEQFSDGVGYQWRDGIIAMADKMVSDDDFKNRQNLYPVSTPMNKEQFWYRRIFQSHFPSEQAVRTVPHNKSIACSTEKALEWDAEFQKQQDESGRAVFSIHNDAQKFKDDYEDKQVQQQQHYLL